MWLYEGRIFEMLDNCKTVIFSLCVYTVERFDILGDINRILRVVHVLLSKDLHFKVLR